MKSAIIRNGSVTIADTSEPQTLQARSVLIKVHAVALSESDVGVTYDVSRFIKRSKLKRGLGVSFVGAISRKGDNASRFSVNDLVFGLVRNPLIDSTISSFIVIPEDACAKLPTGLNESDAVSLVFDALMAERALRVVKACDADSILLTGGTTALARAIIQVAKSSMFGVEWIASTVNGSFAEREYAESVGADETFDVSCNRGNWSRAFESGVNKKEYDIVIDIVGDSKHAKKLLKPGTGRFISLFNKATPEELLDFDSRMQGGLLGSLSRRALQSKIFGDILTGCSGRRRKNRGSTYLSVLPSGDGEILERLAVLMDTELLTPLIERQIGLDDLPSAYSDLRKNPFKYRGRIVVNL